jgi:uncharacterized membrane-anchored protein
MVGAAIMFLPLFALGVVDGIHFFSKSEPQFPNFLAFLITHIITFFIYYLMYLYLKKSYARYPDRELPPNAYKLAVLLAFIIGIAVGWFMR